MTTMHTDDDLERLLRSTFDSRAATVASGPAWAGLPAEVRSHRRWTAPLAAAALVLALVAAFAVMRGHRHAQPADSRPDFTSFDVGGYQVVSRSTYSDGLRVVVVRTPHATSFGDVAVYVYAPHAFEFSGLQDEQRVAISGHRGFTGWSARELYHHRDRPLHAVAWQFAPDQWAVVQQMGNLRVVPSPAQLVRVARAVQPEQHLPLTTPFRISALPAGYRFDHTEVQRGGVLILVLEVNPRRTLTMTAMPADSRDGRAAHGPGVVRHGDTVLEIDASHFRGGLTVADTTAAQAARSHVVWERSTLDHVVP